MALQLRELMLAVAVDNTSSGDHVVIDVEGLQLVKQGTTRVLATLDVQPSAAAVSHDGTLLAVATYKEVSLYTLPKFEKRWTVTSAYFESRWLRFVGDSLWHCARTGSERLSLKNGKQQKKFGLSTRVWDVSQDGNWWLGGTKVIGVASVGPVEKKRAEFSACLAAFLPSGDVFVVDDSGTALMARLVDPATGQVRKELKLAPAAHPVNLTISRGRRAVFRGDSTLVVVDTETLKSEAFAQKTVQLGNMSLDDQTLLAASTRFELCPSPL